MKKNALFAGLVCLLTVLPAAAAWSQDFERSYPVSPDGRVSISNVSGEIRVAGYNGTSVLVTAYREGRDRDMVEIVDESPSGEVVLKVRYPQGGGGYDASVRFLVQVPRGVPCRLDSLSTASGNIAIEDVAGLIRARTASGDVTVSGAEGDVNASTASGDIVVRGARGLVTAKTASGDVEVELTQVGDRGEMAFSSASGDVTVRVPGQLDADVLMSTASGSLDSDFPLTLDDREGHGKKAFGKVGSGAISLKISTASGNVRLVHS